jgi:hypothetical protein
VYFRVRLVMHDSCFSEANHVIRKLLRKAAISCHFMCAILKVKVAFLRKHFPNYNLVKHCLWVDRYAINVKNFWDVTSCSLVERSQYPENPAASVFRVKEASPFNLKIEAAHTFRSNAGIYLPKCTVSHHRTQSYSNSL